METDPPGLGLGRQLGARLAEHAGAHVERLDVPDPADEDLGIGPGAAARVEHAEFVERLGVARQAAEQDLAADRHPGLVVVAAGLVVGLGDAHGTAPPDT